MTESDMTKPREVKEEDQDSLFIPKPRALWDGEKGQLTISSVWISPRQSEAWLGEERSREETRMCKYGVHGLC